MPLPKKLKKDSIIETVFEVRFESDDFPEVILGKLLSVPAWSKFSKNRTAVADVPTPIRIHNEQLKHQPLMQLMSEDGHIAVKIGSNVFSYNNMRSYKGWDSYSPGIREGVGYLLEKVENIKIKRMGLRYINALNQKDHLIDSVNVLNINVKIAGSDLSSSYNLNYVRSLSDTHEATIRISTPEFVKGIPETSTALIDIDVYSKQMEWLQSQSNINKWIEEAHNFEKEEFFDLIPNEIVEKIKEE